MKHIRIRLVKPSDLIIGFNEVLNIINPIKLNPKTIRNAIKNINTFIYVAEKEKPSWIVGTLTLTLNYKCGGHLALIEDVAVLPSYENRGIGSFLMRYALAEAERMGCYKVILLCLDNNVEFYKKNGMDLYQNCMCKKLPIYYKNKEG